MDVWLAELTVINEYTSVGDSVKHIYYTFISHGCKVGKVCSNLEV